MRRESCHAAAATVLAIALGLPATSRSAPDPAPRSGSPVFVRGRFRATIAEITRLQAIRSGATAREDDDAGEGEAREQVRYERSLLPPNPASALVARWPARAAIPDAAASGTGRAAATTLSAQTVGLSFTGATYAGVNPSGLFPPDGMGAVGPTQYVIFINGRIVSFDKSTGLADGVLNVTPDAFFFGAPPYTTDPRIRYDRLSARWYLAINRMNSPDEIAIAISDSGAALTPSTAFTYLDFPVDALSPPISSTCFADFPTLAIDANALYIGTNNYCTAGAGTGSDLYVIQKRSALDPVLPLVITVFRGVSSATIEGPFTPHGVDNFDPTATEGYAIGVDNMMSGTLSLLRISDPGGTPTISASIPIPVPATAQPIRVQHLGNSKGVTGALDGIDDRLTSAVMRGRHLWTAHNLGVDNTGVCSGATTRNGSRWYELDVPPGSGTPSLLQSGTVYAASAANTADQRCYWIPSLMVSGQGHMAMGFSTAGLLEHINAGTVGRLAGDPPGTTQSVQMLTNSAYGYNPGRNVGGPYGRRWGDYSYTSVDPVDDQTMWTIQEYCDQAGSYGLVVARLMAPPPATPDSVTPAVAGDPPATVTLTGRAANGAAFFDPGPDLPGLVPYHHLQVALRNAGATGTPPAVLSSAWVNDTTIALVVAPGAATVNLPGEAYTVDVTNPDGQVASAAVLRVVASATGVPAASGLPFALGEPRPNPTAGGTRIAFQLPRAARVRLSVLDVQGREVAVLVDGARAAGPHEAAWSGRNGAGAAAAGVYFVRLTAPGLGRDRVRRVVVMP